jgi:sterol desaturase/sphingolipid hydroxylase (fatty acid hydroxylase superfamily)
MGRSEENTQKEKQEELNLLDFIWNPYGYFFWLLVISILCWILERFFPWRKGQKAFRDQISQDFFWLIFNGHFAGVLLAYLTYWVVSQVNSILFSWDIPAPEYLNLLSGSAIWIQFVAYFILSDFIEWCVHNLLHRISWMWEFHKLHHSILELDWIGNFRFHWMEIIIYRAVKYFPLIILGVSNEIILTIAIVATLIGHLNHSNLKMDYGIFRYILNSPRFHVWHHDVILQGQHGQNFAIVFSIWDWIFNTVYYPSDREQPESLGFEMIEKFPKGLLKRFFYPITR